jgi:hypothetical protein
MMTQTTLKRLSSNLVGDPLHGRAGEEKANRNTSGLEIATTPSKHMTSLFLIATKNTVLFRFLFAHHEPRLARHGVHGKAKYAMFFTSAVKSKGEVKRWWSMQKDS